MEYIWHWFQDIFNPGEGINGSLLPTYAELESYSRLVLGHPMRSYEVTGIMRLAQTYVNVERRLMNRKRAEMDAANGKPQMKTVSMTDASGLKALFAGKGSRPRAAAQPPRSSD